MSERSTLGKVSLEKLTVEPPKNKLPKNEVVYRMTNPVDERSDQKPSVTISIVNPQRIELLKWSKDASIAELTERMATTEYPLKEILEKHRRGKAIKFLRTTKKILQKDLGESLDNEDRLSTAYRGDLVVAIEQGRRDMSSIELQNFLDVLAPTSDQEQSPRYQEAYGVLISDMARIITKEQSEEEKPKAKTYSRKMILGQAKAAQISPDSVRKILNEEPVTRIILEKYIAGLESTGAPPEEIARFEAQLMEMPEVKGAKEKRNQGEKPSTVVELARLTGFSPSTVRRMLSEHGTRNFSASALATFIEKAQGVLSHEQIAALEDKLSKMRGDKGVKERKPYKRKKQSRITNFYLAEMTGISEITISRILNEHSGREVSNKTLDTFQAKIAPHGLTLEGLREDRRVQERKKITGRMVSELAQLTDISETTVRKMLSENGTRNFSANTLATFIEKNRDALPQEKIKALESKLAKMKEDKQKKEERARMPVSSDIKKAGKIYGDIIKDLKESSGDTITQIEESIAKTVEISSIVFRDFRNGRTKEPRAELIMKALSYYLPPEDPRYMEIQEIFVKREKETKKWLVTLTQEGMTDSKAIKYIRLSTGLPQSEFAKKVGVHRMTIHDIENGAHPILYTLNEIVDASPLSFLGTDSKPKQLMRLKAYRKNPISINALATNKNGDLVQYFRIIKGKTSQELAKDLGYTVGVADGSMIQDIENHRKALPESKIDAFIAWLGLEQNSPLAQVLGQKLRNEEVSEQLLSEVLTEKYLFQEHMPIHDQKNTVDPQLEQLDSFGAKFAFLLTSHGYSLQKFSEIVGSNKGNMSRIKTGKRIPEDYRVISLMKGFGYDIHNPTTWHMLDSAEAERKAA